MKQFLPHITFWGLNFFAFPVSRLNSKRKQF